MWLSAWRSSDYLLELTKEETKAAMTRWMTCWLTALLLAASPGWADFTYHFSPPYSQSGVLDRGSEGLQGLHLNRDPSDFYWHGISWDFGGQFAWASGLDMTLNYSYGPQTGS